MKLLHGFLFCSTCLGLALFASHPRIIANIQSKFNAAYKTILIDDVVIPERKPFVIPKTNPPDENNLPKIKNIDDFKKNDLWIAPTPCEEDIFDAPLSLSGLSPRQKGPFLTEPIKTKFQRRIINQPTYLYKGRSGITLKYVKPVIEYYDVSGLRYKDAQKDIHKRKTIETLRRARSEFPQETERENNANEKTKSTVVGSINYPYRLSYTMIGLRDHYGLNPTETVMTTAYYIMLPRWKNYDTAASSEQKKWDDFFCKVANHELGHLRINLDLIAETLEGYAALPLARSFDEIEGIVKTYQKKVRKHIQDRQDAYHIYNGNGDRRGMRERPYMELPFPWLQSENTEIKTVEQLLE